MPFPSIPHIICPALYSRSRQAENEKRAKKGLPPLKKNEETSVFQCGGICRGKDRFDVTVTCKLCGAQYDRPVSKDKANRSAKGSFTPATVGAV